MATLPTYTEQSSERYRSRFAALLWTLLACGPGMMSACGAPQPPIVIDADDLQSGPPGRDGRDTFIVTEQWMLARLRLEQQLEADLAACRARE